MSSLRIEDIDNQLRVGFESHRLAFIIVHRSETTVGGPLRQRGQSLSTYIPVPRWRWWYTPESYAVQHYSAARTVGPRRSNSMWVWGRRCQLEMPFSGKLQTETKPIPMKLQPQKPNTKLIFILPRKYQYLTKLYIDRIQDTDKMPRKYHEISGRNTKYRFYIGIFLIYQILGYRLASLVPTYGRDGDKHSDHREGIKERP